MRSLKHLAAWTLLSAIVIAVFITLPDTQVAAAGNETNVTNTTLDIWHIPASVQINGTAQFFANYTSNSSVIGIDFCTIDLGEEHFMDLNMSTGIYEYRTVMNTSGNHTYTVNCDAPGYRNASSSRTIEVLANNHTQIIDQDNDTYEEGVDCIDTDPMINPGMNETLYNGVDDDCNPQTSDDLSVRITTDQQSYQPGSVVAVRINATTGSEVYLTVNTPTNVSYVYIFSNGSYPVTQQFDITDKSGSYEIEATAYMQNYTAEDMEVFAVQSTFDMDMSISPATASVGQTIHFKATPTGAIGNVNMIWNMDNGVEEYDQEFDFAYNTSGTYDVVLIATDQGGNQIVLTQQVMIREKHRLDVTVRQNTTNAVIKNASVTVDGKTKKTNNTGKTSFVLEDDDYEIDVQASGYVSREVDVELNQTRSIIVKLVQDTADIAPKISLKSPQNESGSYDGFVFSFADNTESTCTVYVSEGDGWWSDVNSSVLAPGKDHTFSPKIEHEVFFWKVECIDDDENIAYSPTYFVNRTQAAQEAPGTYNVVQNVYDVIPDFDTYSPDEKSIVEYLQLDVLIKDAERRLEMANRDLYNLRLQPDTDSVIQARDEIYARIDEIKDQTPESVRVQDKAEFVKYVNDEEAEELLNEYFELKETGLTDRQREQLIEQNKQLQKKVSIETTAYQVQIGYISQRQEDVTLIVRRLNLDAASKDVMYVEFMPKDIVDSTDKIVFIQNPKVLKKDPVFEIPARDLTEFVYYIEEDVSLDTVPKIKTMAITTAQDEQAASGITGFAVFESLGFSESNAKIFLLEVLVVFVLLGVYVYYYYSSQGKVTFNKPKIKKPEQPKPTHTPIIKGHEDSHKVNYLRVVEERAKKLLDEGKLEDAALKYHEAKFLYDLLPEQDKPAVYGGIVELADSMISTHIEQMTHQGIAALASGKEELAYELYDEIASEFEKLSAKSKKNIYGRCCELALHLNHESKN